MRSVFSILLVGVIALAMNPSRANGDRSKTALAPTAALDYEFFKWRVEPIFLAKRPGHARCIDCHTANPIFPLQPLPAGGVWSDGDSRKNFEAASRITIPAA